MSASRSRLLLQDSGARRAAEALRPDRDPTELVARAAWSVLIEPGDGIAGETIRRYGAVEALARALDGEEPESAASADLSQRCDARARWMPRASVHAVRQALESCVQVGGGLLLPDDPHWPAGLDDLGEHAPVVLWLRGEPGVFEEARAVAIVGARAATAYGELVAAELAGDLASAGITVVSGGAYGIDAAAHRAALGAGGRTVAFLAGGIDRTYPAGHHQLFQRVRERGAVVSEVPCGAAPTKWRFLQRNRCIAAAGRATVVVEAGWRSGSLNTAGHASALGRPLGAVPGPVTSAASAGCHRLLREYDAICVTNAAEVRELWGETEGISPLTPSVDPEQLRLRDALSTRTAHGPEELARRSGLSVERVRMQLGLLAADGAAQRLAEGWVRIGRQGQRVG